MFYKLHYLTLLLIFLSGVKASATDPGAPKPKLIVGIVVDQMRYDYLTRYWHRFGNDGFRKLVNGGFNCSNTHHNYIPTYTGPGHASIYTGTTPAVHGIIGNDWYNRNAKRRMYVTEDTTMTGTGTTAYAGKMSPVNLLTTTFSDELRLASNLRSKVIGVALKDRGSILPAGHSANAAYWLEGSTGNWISSGWYLKALPEWVNTFNARKLPVEYVKNPWTTLYPIESYTASTADDTPYEDLFHGETKPVFPHSFPATNTNMYQMFTASPYGNNITKEFAITAMKAEELGKDSITDLLAVSFSSPDFIGHQYGTHAVETEDCYLRLDRDIAELITAAEEFVGKGNVLFFLTADHAAIPNVKFLADQQIPAGIYSGSRANEALQKHLNETYGIQKWVLSFYNDQIHLDHDLLRKNKIDADVMTEEIRRFFMQYKDIANVLTGKELSVNEYTWGIRSYVQKGFSAKRSGDVVLILEPGLVEYKSKGTDHGAGYTYDTHVPLLFYGWNISPGSTSRHINITDIAPTITQMLGIQAPSGCTGTVISELLK
ncbi:MAG: alkaline phosphatase family protein [Bacteroidota bacterium]|nr:alkaline phosphatase family protein [Bacteroidota bacterium]